MAEYSIEFTHIPKTLKEIKPGRIKGPILEIAQAYRTCWELNTTYQNDPQLVQFNLIKDNDIFMTDIQLKIGESYTVFDAIQARFNQNIKSMQQNGSPNNSALMNKRRLYREVVVEIQEIIKPNAQTGYSNNTNQRNNYRPQNERSNNIDNQFVEHPTPQQNASGNNGNRRSPNQTTQQSQQSQPQIIEKVIKEKEKGSVVKVVIIVLLLFYSIIISILFLTGFGQKTLYVSEENPLLEAYRSALTIGAKDGAERLDTVPKDKISKKDHASVGLIYIRNGEYDKALEYLSKEEVEELLFDGGDLSTLQAFNEEYKTDIGSLDIAILSKKYEDILSVFEAKEDWKLTEKRLAYVSLAYLHSGDIKKAQELADKTNSASLKQKISDYTSLKDNIKTYEDQLSEIKDDSNKAVIENKISETNDAIEQLFK